jgi:Tfp pilus assembly protein FimT
MSHERGFTVAEMVMGIAVFMIVLSAILAMVEVAVHNQDRVARRVAANQRARPLMTRLVDQLHSGCVAPAVAPVLAGSTASSIAFISKSGSTVSPTPDKYVVSFSNGALTESVYPATGGSPPTWTFSGTPSSTRELLKGVTNATAGSPSATVPVFRYYAYVGGELSATPLSTPLSAADAAKTVQVNVSFATQPATTSSQDPNSAVSLSDAAILRLEPASEDSAEVNLPCV